MLHLKANYSKDEITSCAESNAKRCDEFVRALAIAKDVAKDFDGKVVNVRMERAVNAKLDAAGVAFNVRLGAHVACYPMKTGWRMEMHFWNTPFGYLPSGRSHEEVDLAVTSDRRMDAAETIAQFERAEVCAIENKDEWNDAVENYDKYMAMIDELNAALDKYNNRRNYVLSRQAWLSN